ncbi:stalk domain-containing protein [Paenibacillus sp.]|uniref:stalk domain-containing protein n=1 Tax=Paenibacillus sp. TaxID=58172 RepID=UPI002811417E|nr:stalk domain-containing protein [Paenibacillus sp.]
MVKKTVGMALVLSMLFGLFGATASAAPTAAMKVWLYVNKPEAFVNGQQTLLTSPATVSPNGKMYVPVKFLGDTFGLPVVFDGLTNTIAVTAGKTNVAIDLTARTALIDGMPGPMEPTFLISKEGKLMAQLTWFMDRIGAKYEYDGQLNRVEVVYVPPVEWSPELPSSVNGKPIAKFTFGKDTYKMGELVKYIDLSYDVEGDGIQFASWKNKQDAFFTPGTHEVSMQVTDSQGNVSEWFTKNITITNETMYDKVVFQMQHAKLQSFVKLEKADIAKHITSATKLPVASVRDESRELLVSDSPENIVEYGVLYRDQVEGKARLYANHINEMDADVQFAIIATNQGTEPVTIETTRQGEVYPSTFINLIGYQASVDFLVGDANKPTITVEPGESKAYAYLPKLTKGQGINLMYDVETSDELTFTFAAMMQGEPMEAALGYKELPYDRHVRGSFPISEVQWEADASTISGAKKFTIGDNADDKYVQGYDVFRQQTVENYGNYGVVYNIRVKNPGKSALVMLARGGIYKGPLKINGEMVLAPASGVITALDGVFMLYRTTGNEPYLDIELTPPAGSYLPIDLVLYPLN